MQSPPELRWTLPLRPLRAFAACLLVSLSAAACSAADSNSASAAAITVSRRGADLPTADDVLAAWGEPTR